MISDLKQAVRMLRRSPASTLVVLLMVALGIGANTVMFSIWMPGSWSRFICGSEPPRDHPQARGRESGRAKVFVSSRDWDE